MCQHTNLDYHPIIKPGNGKTPCVEWSPIKTAIGIAIRLPEGSFVEGSLEVKLPTIWTDEKAEVGRVREEKRREEKRREEKRRRKQIREEKKKADQRREEESRSEKRSRASSLR